MADKIPSDVGSLALSLHTDLATLNTYADKPDVVAALVPLIFEKIRTIENAVISAADAAGVCHTKISRPSSSIACLSLQRNDPGCAPE